MLDEKEFLIYSIYIECACIPFIYKNVYILFLQVEWDNKVFKTGQLVRILRTLPVLYGSISRIMLYGDHTGDVFATGGDLEVIQVCQQIQCIVQY